jgi:ABC-2 type transport system ATP-binding protein
MMIVAEALSKYYGRKPAVQEVSFQIVKGETVGLLGPNGAGKTTILRILTCFMPPTSGKITVDGQDGYTHSLAIRSQIGFLPETVPLYSELSVQQFLDFAGTVKGLRGRDLDLALERVSDECGLKEHRKRLIKHLSKGLKQRVGLAQALISNPPILVLDEPTTGLDPAQIVEMRKLLRDLAGERTILLSTHILPEASQVCRRVIILNKGRVVAEDTPQNLTNRLQKGLRTILFIDGPPAEILVKLKAVAGVQQVHATDRSREYIVESAADDNIRPMLAKTVVHAGWDLRELRASELSLEEIFVQLVTDETREIPS